MAKITGSCLCGAVVYKISVDPIAVGNCHCRACQRATGAPFFTEAFFPRDSVSVTGELTEYSGEADSGATAYRSFCSKCGSLILAYGDDPELVTVSVATFDEPARYPPQLDIWVDFAQPWTHMDSHTPKYARSPKERQETDA